MKKLLFFILLFINQFIIGQNIVGQLDDSLFIAKSFFKTKKIDYKEISTNDIWFGIFLFSKQHKILRFTASFKLPPNVILYNKIYLNGSKTTAGYNPVWAVVKKSDHLIKFDFTKTIRKKQNRFFWFHLSPIYAGTGKISVDYRYEYENGKVERGNIKSGEIISTKPPIKELVLYKGNDKYEMRFYLKYDYDFEYYIKKEDNPVYEITLKAPNGEEIKLNSNEFFVLNDNQKRLYTIKEGKIKIQNTEWDVSGMSFVVNGKIVERPVPVIASAGTHIRQVDLIGFDNMEFYVTGKSIPYNFNKHPSQINIGLNLVKIRFKGGFHFIPVSINLYSRFKDESFWVMDIKSEYQLNNLFSISFGGGIGYETSWQKMDFINNIITYELGTNMRLGMFWNILKGTSLKISAVVAHLSDAHEANISGIYLGISKILPTKIIK
jgi:hypothetical protein